MRLSSPQERRADIGTAGARPTQSRISKVKTRNSTWAFTIIEIMLAMGIFAMVLTAIYACWIAILKGSHAGLKAAAEVQRARIAVRTLEDAFLGTEMFFANIRYYLFFADTSGDMAAVSMAARLPATFPGVARYPDQVVRRVNFYTQPGKDGMSELIMEQSPILMNTNEAVQPYSLTLAKDVTLFRLAFYDAQKAEWLDEWKYTNKMPVLVQIALGLGKTQGRSGEPSELVYSLVALPSVGVGLDAQGGPFPGQQPPTGLTNGLPQNPNDPNNPYRNPNQNPFNNPYGNQFNRGNFNQPGQPGGGLKR
jgi:hypothetical protein